MRHHKHPGLVGQLAASRRELEPHPALAAGDDLQVWIPLPDSTGREIDAVESITCVPTRPGSAQVLAVPHIAVGLAFGDELAIDTWEGNDIARGALASSLHGTVRVVMGERRRWLEIADALDALVRESVPESSPPWFDVMTDEAVAVAVPRPALTAVFAELSARADRDELRWEYATAERHASTVPG